MPLLFAGGMTCCRLADVVVQAQALSSADHPLAPPGPKEGGGFFSGNTAVIIGVVAAAVVIIIIVIIACVAMRCKRKGSAEAHAASPKLSRAVCAPVSEIGARAASAGCAPRCFSHHHHTPGVMYLQSMLCCCYARPRTRILRGAMSLGHSPQLWLAPTQCEGAPNKGLTNAHPL